MADCLTRQYLCFKLTTCLMSRSRFLQSSNSDEIDEQGLDREREGGEGVTFDKGEEREREGKKGGGDM